LSRTQRRRLLALPAALAAVAVLATPALAVALVGTDSHDSLIGTPASDVVRGLNGQDGLAGLGGNDQLDGGDGQDALSGGPGNDVADGGPGQDDVVGGPGTDTLRGGDGQDEIVGYGDGVVDRLVGGPGYDTAWVGPEDVVAADVEAVHRTLPPCDLELRPEDAVPCETPPDGAVTGITGTTIRGFASDYDFAGPVAVHVYRGAQFLGAVIADGTATYPADGTQSGTKTLNSAFTFVHNQGTTAGLVAYAINVEPAGMPAGPNPSLPFDPTPFQIQRDFPRPALP